MTLHNKLLISIFAALYILSGCGGGGGGSSSSSSTQNYTLGGSVTGLSSGTSVTLKNSYNNETVTVSSNTSFAFATAIPSGSSYTVSVAAQPSGNRTCSVTSGASGTIATNVSNVTVSCVLASATIGGSVTGLDSGTSVTLKNSYNNETVTVSSNTSFTFATGIPGGSVYTITVATQPVSGKICSVTSGETGTVAANVTNITVACAVTLVLQVDVAQVLSQPVGSAYQSLVRGRDALVRAYVYSTASNASPAVTLTTTNGGTVNMTCPNPLPTSPPASPIRVYTKAGTCFFNIPASQVNSGMGNIVVSANGVTKTTTPVFSNKSVINVIAVPITINGRTGIVPDTASIAAKIKSRMPFATVNVTARAAFAPSGTFDDNLTGSHSCAANADGSADSNGDFGCVLTLLESLRTAVDGSTSTLYYGFAPFVGPAVSGQTYTVGLGYIGAYYSSMGFDTLADSNADGTVANGFKDRMWYNTMIHEIGHNMSLKHASCGINDSSVDSFWYGWLSASIYPTWTGITSGKLSTAALYEQTTDTISNPANSGFTRSGATLGTDIMGYCGGEWFSEYNYNKIAQYAGLSSVPVTSASSTSLTIAMASTASTATPQQVLRISGSIANGVAKISPVQLTQGLSTSSDAGDYVLRLTTSSNKIIEQHFSPVQVADGKAAAAHFFITIADPGELAAIEILEGSTSIYKSQQQVGAMSATTGDSSSDGLSINESNGRVRLTWNNALYRWLQLVHIADDGRRTALAVHAQGGALDLPTTDLGAGGKWEVSLSNGLNAKLKTIVR